MKLSDVHVFVYFEEWLVVYDTEDRCSHALVWEVLDCNGSDSINDTSCYIGYNNEH